MISVKSWGGTFGPPCRLVQVGIGPGPVIGSANFHLIDPGPGPGPVSQCTDNFGPGAGLGTDDDPG
jgi:hypothetical protein